MLQRISSEHSGPVEMRMYAAAISAASGRSADWRAEATSVVASLLRPDLASRFAAIVAPENSADAAAAYLRGSLAILSPGMLRKTSDAAQA